ALSKSEARLSFSIGVDRCRAHSEPDGFPLHQVRDVHLGREPETVTGEMSVLARTYESLAALGSDLYAAFRTCAMHLQNMSRSEVAASETGKNLIPRRNVFDRLR